MDNTINSPRSTSSKILAIVSAFLVLFATVGVLLSPFAQGSLSRFVKLTQVVTFILCCVCCVAAFFFFYYMFNSKEYNFDDKLFKQRSSKSVSIFSIVLIVLWCILFADMYRRAQLLTIAPVDTFPWQNVPLLADILSGLVVLLVFWHYVHHYHWMDICTVKTGFKIFYIALVAFLAFLQFASTYHFNNLTTAYGTHHSDAFFNSIYNAYHHVPYDDINYSIYGHYGIVADLIFKVIGLQNFQLFMALLNGALMVMFGYCAYKMIKNSLVKCLVLIPMTFMFVQSDAPYYQLKPHRIIFLSIFAAIFVWMIFHNKQKSKLLGIMLFILDSVAILCNLESGLYCLISLMGFYIIGILGDGNWKSPRMYFKIIGIFLMGLGSFLLAWFATSLWNITVAGGEFMPLRDFLVPVVSFDPHRNFIHELELPLPNDNNIWLHATVIFLFFILYAFLHSKILCGKKLPPYLHLCAAMGVVGLVGLIHYANRVTYWACPPFANALFIMIGVLVDLLIQKSHQWNRRTLPYGAARSGIFILVSAVLISSLFTMFIFADVTAPIIKNNFGSSKTQFEEFLNTVEAEVPKDTPAIGEGTSLIYGQLGWDKQFYMTDVPALDLSLKAIENCYDRIADSDTPLFINSTVISGIDELVSHPALNYIPNLERRTVKRIIAEDYTVLKKFPLGENVFLYVIPDSLISE